MCVPYVKNVFLGTWPRTSTSCDDLAMSCYRRYALFPGSAQLNKAYIPHSRIYFDRQLPHRLKQHCRVAQALPPRANRIQPAFYSQLFRDDKCFLLWVEAKLLAIRDAKFRARFNAFTQEKREYIANYIRAFSERVGTPLPLPAETLALGLVGLCDGAQFLRMCDPQHVTEELTESMLAGFFSRVMFG
jgi:hypothetical protein